MRVYSKSCLDVGLGHLATDVLGLEWPPFPKIRYNRCDQVELRLKSGADPSASPSTWGEGKAVGQRPAVVSEYRVDEISRIFGKNRSGFRNRQLKLNRRVVRFDESLCRSSSSAAPS